MRNQEIYLKSFDGFYNSIWEPCENQEIDHVNEQRTALKRKDPIDFNDFKFDYSEYRDAIGENFAGQWFDVVKDFASAIFFQEIDSPKEYNFRTDKIICDISLNSENEAKITAYLNDNFEEFEEYINKNYSSYSGFISFYSNDAKEWLKSSDLLTDYNKISGVLDFIFKTEYSYFNGSQDPNNDFYNYSEVYINCTNSDELINRLDDDSTDNIFAVEFCDGVIFSEWSNIDFSRPDYGTNSNQLKLNF